MGWKRRVGDRGNEENGVEERSSPEKREEFAEKERRVRDKERGRERGVGDRERERERGVRDRGVILILRSEGGKFLGGKMFAK